jgi:hypothetical protein
VRRYHSSSASDCSPSGDVFALAKMRALTAPRLESSRLRDHEHILVGKVAWTTGGIGLAAGSGADLVVNALARVLPALEPALSPFSGN